jgi:hypothetical protein
MIREKPYDNPQEVRYLSAIVDETENTGKTIGFRKLDGSFLPLIGDVTQVDIASAAQDALHELETLEGLYAHDGKPDEQFQLKFKKLDALRHVVSQLTIDTNSHIIE